MPYVSYRYGWGPFEVGLSLALVGVLLALSQRVLVGRMVGRFGEMPTLIGGLTVGMLGCAAYGLASQGWMLLLVTVAYVPALGLINPLLRSLMSVGVPPTEQGLLQGALTSSNTLIAVVAPLMANSLFAFFVGSSAPWEMPGAPFFIGSLMFVAALVLAQRQSGRFGSAPRAPD